MKRRLPILACLLLPSGAAWGQAQGAAQLDRFERQLEQIQRQSRVLVDESIPPAERALVDYGAYLSVSYLSLDDAAGRNHALRQYELVGYGRLNFDGAHELFVRGRGAFNDYNRGDAFDGRGDDWESPVIERAHYRFDLQRAMAAYGGRAIDYNVTAQVGRQMVTWGNGLTLSEVVDGGVASFAAGDFSVDLIGAVTYDDVTDFDLSRPDFRNDTHRGLFGAMVGTKAGVHRAYAYGLVQRDYNGAEKLATDAATTRFDYNSYYLGLGASGPLADDLLYGVEFVYEGGRTLSNSFDPATATQLAQSRDDIRAFALNARLDYVLADRGATRVGLELTLASGDSDRLSTSTTLGGNRPGTADHAFNALGLLNTGLAFAPSASNLALVRAGASTSPLPSSARFRQVRVGADVLVFNKLLAHGPIDEATNDDRYLGTEADLFATWQVTSDVSLFVRYGIFFPGPSIEGDASARNFFYTGFTYAF